MAILTTTLPASYSTLMSTSMSSIPQCSQDISQQGEASHQPEADSVPPQSNELGSSPLLPDLDLPRSELDLTMTFESILSEAPSPSEEDKAPKTHSVQKRASNVLKLTQENEKLQAELRAMTARLEAAERRQQELRERAGRTAGGNATAS